MNNVKNSLSYVIMLNVILFCQPVFSTVEYIAEISRPAVGFPSNYVYWDVNNPVIGSAGHVAFMGSADTSTQSTVNNTPAIWTGLGSDISLIIKEGDNISGLPANVLFNEAAGVSNLGGSLNVTTSGHVGYIARLKGAVAFNQSDNAVVAYVNGENKAIMRAGDQAPGFPAGILFSGINTSIAFSDAGMLITGLTSQFRQAVWFWDFNTVKLIASALEPADPQTPNCTYLQLIPVGINDAGKIVIQATFSGTGCSSFGAFLEWNNGNLNNIVDIKQAVPGMSGYEFSSLNFAKINNAGDVTFLANVRHAATFTTRSSVWVAKANGSLQLVSIADETLPGHPSQFMLNGFFTEQALSADQATTTFIARTTSTFSILAGLPRASQPYSSLPVSGVSQLSVLAQINQHPPGFPASYFFETLGRPSIAGNGIVGFYASVADANNVFATRKNTLWRGNSEEGVKLLVEPGMSVDVNGVTETLNYVFGMNISLGGKGETSQSGFASQMSETGQVIFQGSTLGDFRNGIFLTDAFDGGNSNGTGSEQIPVPWEALMTLAVALVLISFRYQFR